jgi:hypothetical protein
MRNGLEMTVEDAREALSVTGSFGPGGPLPVLVDARGIRSQTKEARTVFGGAEAARVTSAVALLVGISPVSRMIGNFFLRLNEPPSPTQLFSEERPAIEWLTTFVK